MSIRLRMVLLVITVAVGAIGATAWLTLRQATAQVRTSAITSQETTELIRSELYDFALRRGTWEGVAAEVHNLWLTTGERIRLTEESTLLPITDTDTMQGRKARRSGAIVVRIDPRPNLVLANSVPNPQAVTLAAIERYRGTVLTTACLSRMGLGSSLRVIEGADGVPRLFSFSDEQSESLLPTCSRSKTAGWLRAEDAEQAGRCGKGAGIEVRVCLQSVFRQQISTGDVAPVPIVMSLGTIEDPAPPLDPVPVLLLAGGIAVLAVGGTLLITRFLLRPIGALTEAAGRLGSGDLTGRVPVKGGGELADLARAFNRMADSLSTAEERQRRLTADVAHELRTPLTNLRGYLEALQDGVLTPDAELFASLHEEALLQQRIVDDLQDLAQAEAGVLIYHRRDGDLAEVVESVGAAHQATVQAAGLTLIVQADGPAPVRLDPARIRQVLGNLITNAIRATASGGTVTLSARVEEETAVVRVADTGIGIAEADLPAVFDRFWRADPARDRATGGSGLGLSIVRQIVTDHGGTVTVESTPGVGTAFTVTLPLIAAAPLTG